MFKINGYGNTLEINGVGTTLSNFSNIENLNYNDEVVAYDLSRPLTNLADNDFILYSFLEKMARQLYNKNGVFPGSLNTAFEFSAASNFVNLNFGALGYKTFVTVPLGIAGVGFTQSSQSGWLIVNKPNISEAERQLSMLLGLKPEDDLEYVKIKYNETYKRYKMRIAKCDISGKIILYDFLNPSFPSSTFDNDSIEGGYKNFVELMVQLYTDETTMPLKSALLSNFYYKSTPASLSNLVCQTTFQITTNETYYLKINSSGSFVCNTTSFTGSDFPICSFSTSGVNTVSAACSNVIDYRVLYNEKEIYTKKIDFNTTAEADDVGWIYSDISGSNTIIKHRIGIDTADEIMFEYYNGSSASTIAEFKGDLSATFHGNVLTNANTTLGNLVSEDTLTLNSTILSNLIFNDADRYIKLGGSSGSSTTRTLYIQNDGTGLVNLTVEGSITSTGGDIITGNTTSTLFNTVATTLSIGGVAQNINIGASPASTQTINFGATSTSVTQTVNIGTGITSSNQTINIGTGITGQQIVNIGKAGSTNSTLYIKNDTISDAITTGAVVISGGVGIAKKLYVGSDFYINSNKFSVASSTGNTIIAGTLDINGAYLNTDDTTFYLLNNNTEQIVLIGGASTSTGYTKIQSGLAATAYNAAALVVAGGLGVNGKVIANTDFVTNSGTITSTNTTGSIFTTAVTSLSIGSIAQDINFGINPGNNQTINIGTTNTTYTQTINIGTNIASSAQIINIGKAGNIASSVKILSTTVSNSTTSGSLIVSGGVGIAGAFNVGGASILGDTLAVNGNTISTSTTTTFNLLNTNLAGTLNLAGAAGTVNIGSGSSTTNIGNDLFVAGNQIRINSKYEFNYDSVTNTLDLIYVG